MDFNFEDKPTDKNFCHSRDFVALESIEIKYDYDNNAGNSIVSTKDIKKGTIVMVEDPLCSVSTSDFGGQTPNDLQIESKLAKKISHQIKNEH